MILELERLEHILTVHLLLMVLMVRLLLDYY